MRSILFAHFGLDWLNGAERCLLDLIEHLDRNAFRPVLVCNSPTLADAARSLGATVYGGAEFVGRDSLTPDAQLVARGWEIVRREQIQLIHANTFEPVKWLLPSARRAHIPLLLHVHLPSSEHERCYSWAHQAACVVGCGQSAVRGFLEDGLQPRRIRVIYNAVDPQRLSAGSAGHLRAQLGIGRTTTAVAVVGSLIARKGHTTLLRAMATLRARGVEDVRLLLVGDGPDEDRLRCLAETLDLRDSVLFLGRRADAVAILRDAADIAVTAAREEVFPLNVLEAGFVGLPIVASDIPPHREGIVDGVTGVIVPVDDAEAYAAALARLIADPRLRTSLGDAARERIRTNFLMDGYIRDFSALYERLMDAPRVRYSWAGGTTWPAVYTRWFARAIASRLRGRPIPTPS